MADDHSTEALTPLAAVPSVGGRITGGMIRLAAPVDSGYHEAIFTGYRRELQGLPAGGTEHFETEGRAVKNILVAHDGSKYSQKALKMAIAMALQFGSTLHVLSVVPELHLTEISPIDRERLREALERETAKNLEKVKTAVRKKKVPVKTFVRQGNAADEIIGAARKLRVGLIVIGSHGRHGMERFLLGSVSSKVVEHARRPVLVVK